MTPPQKFHVRRWHLERHEDQSGMSGLGRVAEGVELPNGVAVMWWLVPPHSVQTYRTLDDLRHIHGHGNKKTTTIVYDDVEDGQYAWLPEDPVRDLTCPIDGENMGAGWDPEDGYGCDYGHNYFRSKTDGTLWRVD